MVLSHGAHRVPVFQGFSLISGWKVAFGHPGWTVATGESQGWRHKNNGLFYFLSIKNPISNELVSSS
jgi:hypothetical protein